MTKTTHFRSFTILFVLLFVLPISSQNDETSIIDSFKSHTSTPREQVYLHLNKSTYIKSEAIGFQAYVVDKNLKELSGATTNLYVVVEDNYGNSIKEGLYEVNGGVGNGIIDVDSSFTTGRYKIKAYTNWMRNFEEFNYHAESFNVIDLKNQIEPKISRKQLDLQVVAEGGYFVSGVNQFAGIVAKFSDGSVAEFEDGSIQDANGTIISSFTTNSRGHAKVILKTKGTSPLEVKLKNHETTALISKIKVKGITLNLIDLSDRIAVKLSTNSETLPELQNEKFKLGIHNGSLIKVLDFNFNAEKDLAKIIDKSDLYPGINIFTLFNESNEPLLERMFFKYDGISSTDLSLVKGVQDYESGGKPNIMQDSIQVSFKIKNYKSGSFSKLSASVLPKGTKSYNRHQNLFSSIYLQPYFNHYIDDAQYYFNEDNPERASDLDLLLLTEGWSSYNWNTIFNLQPQQIYNFERGISVRVNVPKTKYDTFVLYTTDSDESSAIQIGKDQSYFERINLFPSADENIQIAALDKKNKPKKVGFAPVFFPRVIPKLSNEVQVSTILDQPFFDYPLENDYLDLSSEGYETLEEVILYANYRKEKIRKNYKDGDIFIFDDELKKEYFELGPFLRSQDFIYNNVMRQQFTQATFDATRFSTSPRNGYSIVGYPITATEIYIDNVRVWLPWDAVVFETDAIDYVVIDKKVNLNGLGTAGIGQFSGNGFDSDNAWYMASVYVHTNQNAYFKKMDAKMYNQFELPLAFESQRSFYTPRYPVYNARFFEEYGVLNWQSNITPDTNGIFSIKIPSTYKKDVSVFIEGVVDSDTFISKKVNLEVVSTSSN